MPAPQGAILREAEQDYPRLLMALSVTSTGLSLWSSAGSSHFHLEPSPPFTRHLVLLEPLLRRLLRSALFVRLTFTHPWVPFGSTSSQKPSRTVQFWMEWPHMFLRQPLPFSLITCSVVFAHFSCKLPHQTWSLLRAEMCLSHRALCACHFKPCSADNRCSGHMWGERWEVQEQQMVCSVRL